MLVSLIKVTLKTWPISYVTKLLEYGMLWRIYLLKSTSGAQHAFRVIKSTLTVIIDVYSSLFSQLQNKIVPVGMFCDRYIHKSTVSPVTIDIPQSIVLSMTWLLCFKISFDDIIVLYGTGSENIKNKTNAMAYNLHEWYVFIKLFPNTSKTNYVSFISNAAHVPLPFAIQSETTQSINQVSSIKTTYYILPLVSTLDGIVV